MEELISRADVEQTVEDNILCYTHSDKPQDPDTECHMAIRMALRMLMKDLKKLPSAEPNITHIIMETLAECGIYGEEATIKLIGTLKRIGRGDLLPPCAR